MKRMEPMRLSIRYAVLIVALLISGPLLVARSQVTPTPSSFPSPEEPVPIVSPSAIATPANYNPYPPGILPADLPQELIRVQGEINFIEAEAMATAQALPTPIITGQPPTIQGSGYIAIQTLGKLLNYDLSISPFRDAA